MIISEDQFEQRLAALAERVSDPACGVFGPDSLMWKYTRDNVTFIGAWRAVMLQLAHPWVAAAVRDFSKTKEDPLGRFHGTFRVVLRLTYGDLDQALGVARGMHRMHTSIRGPVGDGTGESYHANGQEAMIWVFATLWETLVQVRESLWGEIPLQEKDAFYEETKRFAALFGIDERALPRDWTDFIVYNRDMWYSKRLQVMDSAIEMSEFLFGLNQFPFYRPFCRLGKRYTRRTLPEPIREQFGLAPSSVWNERFLRQDLWQLRMSHRLMPKLLRFGPSWSEAQHRVEHGEPADFAVRLLNRISLGTWDVVGPSSALKQ